MGVRVNINCRLYIPVELDAASDNRYINNQIKLVFQFLEISFEVDVDVLDEILLAFEVVLAELGYFLLDVRYFCLEEFIYLTL